MQIRLSLLWDTDSPGSCIALTCKLCKSGKAFICCWTRIDWSVSEEKFRKKTTTYVPFSGNFNWWQTLLCIQKWKLRIKNCQLCTKNGQKRDNPQATYKFCFWTQPNCIFIQNKLNVLFLNSRKGTCNVWGIDAFVPVGLEPAGQKTCAWKVPKV